jgi:hypothetical protein
MQNFAVHHYFRHTKVDDYEKVKRWICNCICNFDGLERPYTKIENPTAAHIEETCLSDISEFAFYLNAGNFLLDGTRGFVGLPIKTPSGAHLYNIQAEEPFSVVTIQYSKGAFEDLSITHEGLAMANIRYKLAE